MVIKQTVEIPPSRQITINVPSEVPEGTVILTFTPVMAIKTMDDCPECDKFRDSKTGELRYNAQTFAAIEEGRAMMRGDITAQRFNSLEELLADLRS